MERIKLVGLEIEGGWDGKPGQRPFEERIISDFSIDGQTVRSDFPLTCTHVGEVVSKPLERVAVEDWLIRHWPAHTNNTCGYHIHISTKSLKDYSLLTKKSFLFPLVATINKRGKDLKLPPDHYLFKRINANPFATMNFDAANQIRLKAKTIGNRLRYGVFNCAWGIHGTLEFRLFPTFERVDLAIDFTNLYLNEVENYLDKCSLLPSQTYSSSLMELFGELHSTIRTPKESD